MGLQKGIHRTPDALLYASASISIRSKRPLIPNPFDAEANAAKHFHEASPLRQCHTPPFYSNNKLTLAEGFTPSPEERKEFDIMNLSVGTDPGLALKTRKGTGFYRVPSLKMVWTNNAFLHDGSIGSLEELFNRDRLKPDFRSSNWSSNVPSHAVKGHPFGLEFERRGPRRFSEIPEDFIEEEFDSNCQIQAVLCAWRAHSRNHAYYLPRQTLAFLRNSRNWGHRIPVNWQRS